MFGGQTHIACFGLHLMDNEWIERRLEFMMHGAGRFQLQCASRDRNRHNQTYHNKERHG